MCEQCVISGPSRQTPRQGRPEHAAFKSAQKGSGDRTESGFANQMTKRPELEPRVSRRSRNLVHQATHERALAEREQNRRSRTRRAYGDGDDQAPGARWCRQAAALELAGRGRVAESSRAAEN